MNLLKTFYFLLVVSLFGCSATTTMKAPERGVREPTKEVKYDIHLGAVKDPYIDLSKFGDTIVLTGTYIGPRIVLRNAICKVLYFRDVVVMSTSPEEAIVIPHNSSDVELIGQNATLSQSITIWGVAKQVYISGFTIRGAHVGIRATENQPHENIHIFDNVFEDITLEGVYLGPSVASPTKGQHFYVYDNIFKEIGWDAIQLGNCAYGWVSDNIIINAGKFKKPWQDYAITINPGSLVFLWDNTIRGSVNRIQVLDSRCFMMTKNP